jgi:nucleoside-diphosphate-sugar epimerase
MPSRLDLEVARPNLHVVDVSLLDGSGEPGPLVVVTGGAGFVGSVLCRWLLSAGSRVRVIDNLTFGAASLLPLFIHPHFEFVQGDILDRPLMRKTLQDAWAVVHLAALVGYPICKKLPDLARRVNLEGTANVLELASPASPVIFASTGSNYGEVEGVCNEDTPLNPLSLYGETKTLAEGLCLARPNTVSFRFATAFGLSPRLRLDLMINDFTWQALERRYLLVYEKHFRRTFIHVQDMARAALYTLQHFDAMKDRVYNVGSETMNYTKEDITRFLQQRLSFHLYFADIGKDEDCRDYAVSYDRLHAAGFFTAIDIHRGLEELISGLRLVHLHNPYSNV